MTESELPKRVFALEEKDLSVEADENNKVAEEKENRFLKKIIWCFIYFYIFISVINIFSFTKY